MMRIRSLAAVALLASAAACDHVLQTEPYTQVPAEQEIVDAATARGALVGAYDGLQSDGTYGLDVELLGDMPSDNARWAGTYQFLGDMVDNRVAADNPEVLSMWRGLYQEVARDNVILAKVPGVGGLTDDERNDILGQAYFLRALSFHDLVKFWGAVPTPTTPAASAAEAAAYTRTPVDQVYAQILADLDEAQQRIQNTDDTRRATVMAAEALRARVLLYKASLPNGSAADLQGALDAANTVLAGRDTLTVPYADLFSATGQDTEEDIFRVSFTAAEYNDLGYYWLRAGRHEAEPSVDLVNSYETGDVRKGVTLQARSSSRYQGTKFPTTSGTEHPHVIRLAEVVLIKAEALARQGQLGPAVDEYNKVRVRAGLAPHVLGVDVTTQQEVLDAITTERRHELALEGDRWPDLVRLGLAESVKGFSDRPGQALFPLPQRELTTSPGLTQNPGY